MSCRDYRGPLITTEARAAMRGEVSLQLTAWEVLSLAVNVVQNGWHHAELPLEYPRYDLKRPGNLGSVRAAWRDEVLRQVHREILRANRESPARGSRIGHAPDHATTGKLHANENAFEGSNNADQRTDNASNREYKRVDDTALKGSANHSDASYGRDENDNERAADTADESSRD